MVGECKVQHLPILQDSYCSVCIEKHTAFLVLLPVSGVACIRMHESTFRIRTKDCVRAASHCSTCICRCVTAFKILEVLNFPADVRIYARSSCCLARRISVFPCEGRGCRSTRGLKLQGQTKAGFFGLDLGPTEGPWCHHLIGELLRAVQSGRR